MAAATGRRVVRDSGLLDRLPICSRDVVGARGGLGGGSGGVLPGVRHSLVGDSGGFGFADDRAASGGGVAGMETAAAGGGDCGGGGVLDQSEGRVRGGGVLALGSGRGFVDGSGIRGGLRGWGGSARGA